MKNLTMAILISVSSVFAFANESASSKSDKFTEKGVKLLYDNVDNVTVSGDKDAKLKDMLQDIADFHGSKLGSAMTGSDDDDDVKLKDVTIKCTPVMHSSVALGDCEIGLDYKGGDFLEISYFVSLKNKMPSKLFNNRVGIRRY